MNIIPQNLKNEAIKIINSCFSFLSHNLTFSISEFFNSFHSFFYPSFMLNMKEKFNSIIINSIKIAIPLIDKMFLSSNYRRLNFYKCNTHTRSFTTIFGDLEYERIYYTDKNKKNGFYFIDEFFHFESYIKYDTLLRAILIDNSISTNGNLSSNKTSFLIGDYNNYLNNNHFNDIPRQTIYNWIKKWNIPKIEYDSFEDAKSLYVMVDEKWIHEQIRLSTLSDEEKNKHHYIMSKCFVTFTGASRKNKRTKLLNRHIFMTTSDKPWKDFMDEIYNIYNFEEIEKIYLLSDAGTWILAGKNELKLFKNNEVITNICEFHVKQYINRMVRDKEKREELEKTIYEKKDKKEFIKLADEIIEKASNKDKKTQYKNYVLNHWKGILNMQEREIHSSMESHISHCVAATFGSRPKGYSRKRIEKYIKLEEYKQNGINIMDLYLKSRNDEENAYKKEDISFSIFENNISSNIPVKSTSNGISNTIGQIAYGY